MPKVSNDALPLLWVDGSNIFIRGDGTGTLQLYAVLPDRVIEVARLHANSGFWKGLVDMLAESLNHYPERPKVENDK